MPASLPINKDSLSTTQYSELYKNELLENILPFWLRHSKDEVNGGYFTCIVPGMENIRNTLKKLPVDKTIFIPADRMW